jgi:hypothetical protein
MIFYYCMILYYNNLFIIGFYMRSLLYINVVIIRKIYITAPKNIIEYGLYNLGIKYLAANTIMTHIKILIEAGNVNIFYGIGY